MSDITEVYGKCDPAFEGLRDVFQQSFRVNNDVGAAVAIYLHGVCICDMWAGYKDEARTQPWTQDTIVNVYSATKDHLHEQGKFKYSDKVAKYWPEFAQAGKQDVTIEHIMSHQSGVVAIRKKMNDDDIYDWDTMCSAYAEEAPWFPPGSKHGYQTASYGFLCGEVVRRISGKSVGQYWRDEIAKPFGLEEFAIGLNDEEIQRVADVVKADPTPSTGKKNALAVALADPSSMAGLSFYNPNAGTSADTANSLEWARALARHYGILANGGVLPNGQRLLKEKTIKHASTEVVSGPDATLLLPTRFGLGYAVSSKMRTFMTEQSFGHSGMGGSIGFADPKSGIGFGFVMNKMIISGEGGDPRWKPMIDQVKLGVEKLKNQGRLRDPGAGCANLFRSCSLQ